MQTKLILEQVKPGKSTPDQIGQAWEELLWQAVAATLT
jgi:hypothetical protein